MAEWSRKWQPTPVFLTAEFCGQRSLVDHNPRGCKELGTTERLSTQLNYSCYSDFVSLSTHVLFSVSGSNPAYHATLSHNMIYREELVRNTQKNMH